MEEGVQRFQKSFWSWFSKGLWYDVDGIYMYMARNQ